MTESQNRDEEGDFASSSSVVPEYLQFEETSPGRKNWKDIHKDAFMELERLSVPQQRPSEPSDFHGNRNSAHSGARYSTSDAGVHSSSRRSSANEGAEFYVPETSLEPRTTD